MTPEQAEEMTKIWKETFKEMRFHMNPLKSKRADLPYDAYGLSRQDDDEDMEEVEDAADKKKHQYMAILKCGQMRDRCSYNSACNYQFQALVAIGAKVAGWNLVYNGYGDRLLNFVHLMVDVKPGELLEHPNGTISSRAQKWEGSTTSRKTYTQASGSPWSYFKGSY